MNIDEIKKAITYFELNEQLNKFTEWEDKHPNTTAVEVLQEKLDVMLDEEDKRLNKINYT